MRLTTLLTLFALAACSPAPRPGGAPDSTPPAPASAAAASTWLIISSGYARNPQGSTVDQDDDRDRGVSPLNAGAVAAVWNHCSSRSPLTPNVCSVDFGGNNMTITDPIYVIGNMCISGQNTTVPETASGQPIDLMVGGKLVLSGSGTTVGTDGTHPTRAVSSSTAAPPSRVSTASTTCDSRDSATRSARDTSSPRGAGDAGPRHHDDYNNSDPGPKHACAAGGLASTTFDNDGVQNGTNTSFELLPGSSYTCVSQSGAGTGQMSWNNSTKMLTINGNVFLDGNITISQSGTYTGTGVIEAAGTIIFNGNGTAFCATSPCNRP